MLEDIGIYDILKFFFYIYIGYLLYFITDFLDKINKKLDRILEEGRIKLNIDEKQRVNIETVVEPVKTKKTEQRKVKKHSKRRGKRK